MTSWTRGRGVEAAVEVVMASVARYMRKEDGERNSMKVNENWLFKSVCKWGLLSRMYY